MRKNLIYALPFALVGLMATDTNARILFDNVHQIRAMQPAGNSFQERLAWEYRELALFEADQMYDWIDAENHATKGLMAADGQRPMPYDPAEWGIEDPAKLRELQNGRAQLVSLLDQGAGEKAPNEAAVAQAKYDCWVEQQEEGHQFDHIAACRDQFLAALDGLKKAMEQVSVTTTTEEVARQVVYFDFDRSDIRADAQTSIDSFVSEMKKIAPVTLYIEGHADTSGPSDYNVALSAARAAAVRAELERQGMTVGDYKDLRVEAEGESEPAVVTGDGVREPRNRRVEIIAEGEVTRQTTVSGNTAALTQ